MKFTCRRQGEETEEQKLDRKRAEESVLPEVAAETEFVTSLVQPLLRKDQDGDGENVLSVDRDNLPRDDLHPILAHKLRKVYPGLGGLPPKVALASLDLHVPRGQVLGLLGKNGAGKVSFVQSNEFNQSTKCSPGKIPHSCF